MVIYHFPTYVGFQCFSSFFLTEAISSFSSSTLACASCVGAADWTGDCMSLLAGVENGDSNVTFEMPLVFAVPCRPADAVMDGVSSNRGPLGFSF